MLWWDQQVQQGVLHAGRLLPSSGCASLFRPDGSASDNYCYISTQPGQSFGRRSDGSSNSVIFQVPTPGNRNWIYTTDAVLFNEIQSVNTSTVADNYGEYDPWIELFNPTVDTVDLAGWTITNDALPGYSFQFANANDSTVIVPGGHLLVWWDQSPLQGVFHSDATIPAAGCFHLYRPDGTTSDNICYVNIPANQSYGRRSDGSVNWFGFTTPTPDAMNWQVTATDILINEIQTFNTTTYFDTYGESDAWVELYNPGSDTVDLSGWHLSNGLGTVHHFGYDNDSLVMAPMEHLLLWADGETAEGADHLGFSLPFTGCLNLIKPTFERSDSVCYSSIPADNTYGRVSDGAAAWVVFTSPTPDSNNVQLNTGITTYDFTGPLRVYPNPAQGGTVVFNRPIGFSLYDMPGKRIGTYRNTDMLDVSGLDAGCYFIVTEEQEVLRLVLE
jgi:hypothetical protein